MKQINQDIKEFLQKIKAGEPVTCNRNGQWTVQGFFGQLWMSREKRSLSLARGMIHAFDFIESHPIRFGASQPIEYALYIEAAECILELLSSSRSSEAFDLNFDLLRRIIALRYRLEEVNGGHDTCPPDVCENAALREQVVEWKKEQELITTKELTEDECARIQQTVSYSHFLSLIACSESLRERFFTWTIRDKMCPVAFIQYPGMQQTLEDSTLAGRIGRIKGSLLKIKKIVQGDHVEKIMTLPIEGKDCNILDRSHQVKFRGNYTLTIAEVFEVFANKFARAGNLEFLAEGIINWNYIKMGWYDADHDCFRKVNVHKPGWWKQLPIFEVITLEKAKERFGQHMDGKNWNVAAAASRTTATLDYEQTHAYIDIAIPVGGGRYAIYDFGKLANEFPTNIKETLEMFAMNVHASVAYPDESVYYSHRQHTYYSFPMTPEQGAKCMGSIAEDVLIARANNFVYQIESDNCAKWAQNKIEAAIGEQYLPNLFQMHLLATEPFGPVAHIFNFIKKLPKSLRTYVLTRLHLPLGAGRGTWVNENGNMVYKSLSNHDFFETGLVYLPCYLHRQQEMGLIGKVMDAFERIIYQSNERVTKCFFEFIQKLFDAIDTVLNGRETLLERILQAKREHVRVLIPQYIE